MASTPQNADIDFLGVGRNQNMAPANAAGQAVEYAQWLAQIAGLAWKDDVRAASLSNINLASPGTAVDSITLAVGDRFAALGQTAGTENGIYIFNGSAVAATRANDLSHPIDFNAAVFSVDYGAGANSGTRWRSTVTNPTIGTTSITFVNDQPAAAPASESTAGVVMLATQAQTDAGTDNTTAITPLKLATYAGRAKRYTTTIGDGSSTSYNVTHNLNSTHVNPFVREATGSKRAYGCQINNIDANTIQIVTNTAPASNALDVTVIA